MTLLTLLSPQGALPPPPIEVALGGDIIWTDEARRADRHAREERAERKRRLRAAVETAAGLNDTRPAPPALVEAVEAIAEAVQPQDFPEVIQEVRNAARDAAMLTRISDIAARLEALRIAREAEDDDETALLMVM